VKLKEDMIPEINSPRSLIAMEKQGLTVNDLKKQSKEEIK
jgi:hypothetical protein